MQKHLKETLEEKEDKRPTHSDELAGKTVKTTPQKTRFRDVKICKNLGYRLSGR